MELVSNWGKSRKCWCNCSTNSQSIKSIANNVNKIHTHKAQKSRDAFYFSFRSVLNQKWAMNWEFCSVMLAYWCLEVWRNKIGKFEMNGCQKILLSQTPLTERQKWNVSSIPLQYNNNTIEVGEHTAHNSKQQHTQCTTDRHRIPIL